MSIVGRTRLQPDSFATKWASATEEYPRMLGGTFEDVTGNVYRMLLHSDASTVGAVQNNPVGYLSGSTTGYTATVDQSNSAASLFAGVNQASSALVHNDVFFAMTRGYTTITQASASVTAGDQLVWTGDKVVLKKTSPTDLVTGVAAVVAATATTPNPKAFVKGAV